MLSRKKQRKWERKGKNILMRSNRMFQGWFGDAACLWVGRIFLIPVKSVCHLYISELLQRQLGYEALGVFCDQCLPATKLCRVLNLSARCCPIGSFKLDTTPGYHLGLEVACVLLFLPAIVTLTRPMAQFPGEMFTRLFVIPGFSQRLKRIDVTLMQLSLQKLVFFSQWPKSYLRARVLC